MPMMCGGSGTGNDQNVAKVRNVAVENRQYLSHLQVLSDGLFAAAAVKGTAAAYFPINIGGSVRFDAVEKSRFLSHLQHLRQQFRVQCKGTISQRQVVSVVKVRRGNPHP